MNEQNEIGGDLLEEYEAIQRLEADEAGEEAPVYEIDEDGLEEWGNHWLEENCHRSDESWIRCPDCQGEH